MHVKWEKNVIRNNIAIVIEKWSSSKTIPAFCDENWAGNLKNTLTLSKIIHVTCKCCHFTVFTLRNVQVDYQYNLIKMIIRVTGVLRKTNVSTTCTEAFFRVKWSLSVSWKFKSRCERFDWSMDTAAVFVFTINVAINRQLQLTTSAARQISFDNAKVNIGSNLTHHKINFCIRGCARFL